MKPGRLLIVVSALWASSGFIIAFNPLFSPIWGPIGIVILTICVFDALSVWLEPDIIIERKIAHNLPVGSWSSVKLTIHNKSNRSYKLKIYDLHPSSFTTKYLPLAVQLQQKRYIQLRYKILSRTRGDFDFEGIEVIVLSRFSLWQRQRKYSLRETVKVYPNFSEVSKYALLATDNQLSRLGIRQRQRRGQGLEFHQLREYNEGDSIRQIDWNATSRYRKLISREYQDERDQRIVFLVDCGRRMRAEDDGINHFDQSLNSLLLLSYVALRQGDSVSIMAFGGQRRKVGSQKGVGNINTILNQIYDLQTTLDVSDYVEIARELLVAQRKRSLVIILTNARDEDQENLNMAVRLLRTRHLVLVANLREEILDNTLSKPVDNFEQALRYSVVLEYIRTRNRNHDALVNAGALSMNVTARELPISIVNRYLDIKRSNML